MAPHEGRYIVCCCRSLYGASSIAIFDAATERFIYCADAHRSSSDLIQPAPQHRRSKWAAARDYTGAE
jgi:hypothetical protein